MLCTFMIVISTEHNRL